MRCAAGRVRAAVWRKEPCPLCREGSEGTWSLRYHCLSLLSASATPLQVTTGSISLFTHYLHPSPWSRAWSLARTSGTILLLFLSYLGLGVCLHFSETENVEQEKYRGCKMATTKSGDPALSLELTWWKERSSICKLSSGYCGMHTYKANIYIDK